MQKAGGVTGKLLEKQKAKLTVTTEETGWGITQEQRTETQGDDLIYNLTQNTINT